MRGLVICGALMVVAGCGGETPNHDWLTRTVPTKTVVEPTVAETEYPDYTDGGAVVLDGGCCNISFALAAQPGEVAATLLFQSDSFAMALDGGVWRVDACVAPDPNVYYYQAAYPADDDAGVVWVDRVNDAAPESYSSSVASVVNVFDGRD